MQERSGGAATADLLNGFSLDERYARTTQSGTMSFLTDALGSTVALADGFGGISTSYTHEPFGKTTATGAPSDNPYQYTGRENDTGLYHYRARYCSPSMHRFISEDPIGLAGGDVNLYAYAFNIPTMWSDPTGLTIFEDIGEAAGAAKDWTVGAAEDAGNFVWDHRTAFAYGGAGFVCVGTAGVGCGAAVAGATTIDLAQQYDQGSLTLESGAVTIVTGGLGAAARVPIAIASSRSGGGSAAWTAISAGLNAPGFRGYAARTAFTWPGAAFNVVLAGRKVSIGGLEGGG